MELPKMPFKYSCVIRSSPIGRLLLLRKTKLIMKKNKLLRVMPISLLGRILLRDLPGREQPTESLQLLRKLGVKLI